MDLSASGSSSTLDDMLLPALSRRAGNSDTQPKRRRLCRNDSDDDDGRDAVTDGSDDGDSDEDDNASDVSDLIDDDNDNGGNIDEYAALNNTVVASDVEAATDIDSSNSSGISGSAVDGALSAEVREVCGYLLDGKSVLLTGGSGTGKTTSVIDIINEIARQNKPVLLTGSTGQAAAELQAALLSKRAKLSAFAAVPPVVTLDSHIAFDLSSVVAASTAAAAAARRGISGSDNSSSAKKTSQVDGVVLAQQALLRRAVTTRTTFAGLRAAVGGVIVLDEISMVSAEKLKFIVELATCVMAPHKPVLLMVGDFFQLQPVDGQPAFDADIMKELTGGYQRVVTLTENKRQLDDIAYARVLDKMRVGKFDEHVVAAVQRMTVTDVPADAEDALHIAPTNMLCDIINKQAHDALRAKGRNQQLLQYKTATDATGIVEACGGGGVGKGRKGRKNEKIIPLVETSAQHAQFIRAAGRMRDSIVAALPRTERLCVGERVILTANINVAEGLANGVRGVVVGFKRFDMSSSSSNNSNSSSSARRSCKPQGIVVVQRDDNGARINIGYVLQTARDYVCNTQVQTGVYYMPLQSATAITVHAAQGRTLRCKIIVHLEDEQRRQILFGDWCRLLYVALSRGQSKDTYIKGQVDVHQLLRTCAETNKRMCNWLACVQAARECAAASVISRPGIASNGTDAHAAQQDQPRPPILVVRQRMSMAKLAAHILGSSH